MEIFNLNQTKTSSFIFRQNKFLFILNWNYFESGFSLKAIWKNISLFIRKNRQNFIKVCALWLKQHKILCYLKQIKLFYFYFCIIFFLKFHSWLKEKNSDIIIIFLRLNLFTIVYSILDWVYSSIHNLIGFILLIYLIV